METQPRDQHDARQEGEGGNPHTEAGNLLQGLQLNLVEKVLRTVVLIDASESLPKEGICIVKGLIITIQQLDEELHGTLQHPRGSNLHRHERYDSKKEQKPFRSSVFQCLVK